MQHHIESIYLRYYDDLYRYLSLHCSDVNVIDDLIQNTFLEVLKSIERFEGNSSLKTWLFAIAKHQLYRHFRKTKTKVQLENISEKEFATEHDYSQKVLVDEIMEKVSALNPPHDEIMRLRLVYGLSFKEIALRVKQTENYCRVNFYRNKERLRKEFERI